MTYTRQDIHDTTGFDNGAKFDSEQEVRDYFKQEVLLDCAIDAWGEDDENLPSQDELNQMAETVIENRWHMVN